MTTVPGLGKWRRRKPGIYLVRTRKHLGRRRENGYVGLSNHVHLRRLDHLGQGRHGQTAKPWSDLDPVWHVLRLPWWLGFRWTLAPLEFLAIKILLPRYNQTMNYGNPRRVTLAAQKRQRAQRDSATIVLKAHRTVDLVLRAVGAVLLLSGLALIII